MGVLEKFSLKEKVILVTGGAGLYGKHITEGLAEACGTVYLASRDQAKCEEFATTLRTKGYDVHSGKVDQSDTSSILALYRRMIKEQGRIDVLVNNAVARPMKTGEDPVENFDLSMRINATGIFEITRVFAENMVERKSGSIINIASHMGVVGPDFTLYEETSMSAPPDYFFHKAGMINLTKYFAAKYGAHGIRVNAVSPGGLYTNQHERFLERYNKRNLLGRMACGEDIKGVVVFLASDTSLYITGTNIMMDGGYTAK